MRRRGRSRSLVRVGVLCLGETADLTCKDDETWTIATRRRRKDTSGSFAIIKTILSGEREEENNEGKHHDREVELPEEEVNRTTYVSR